MGDRHEIVGKVTRVGSQVKGIKVGDRAGIGAQIGSCLKCRPCESNNENYCPQGIETYNSEYPDGVRTQGGYSTAIRAHERFVFPIPDALESRYAASMLCAGLTVFSPLKRHGAGPGKKVGVIGIGGLVNIWSRLTHLLLLTRPRALGSLCYLVCESHGCRGVRFHAW